MKTKQTIGMSLVLATLISLGATGCSDSDDSSGTTPASTATDVTVERGKVYDANVTDSSTPAQIATQKQGQNVYTFAKAPVYPVVVNGGWIDVNDDGLMDKNDTLLDIEMKSYGITVTPITTVIARESNATKREEMLQDLVNELNTAGVGSATQVTVADLLKVPSAAPHDVMVVANATFKDMKENNTSDLALEDIMTQFSTINSALGEGATSTDAEQVVMTSLESQSLVTKVSDKEIFEYGQGQLEGTVQALETALLKNNIKGLDFIDWYTFNANHTASDGIHTMEWNVNGKVLTLTSVDGDNFEFIFTNDTPVDGEHVTYQMYYFDTDTGARHGDESTLLTITITAPVVVVPDPTVGGGDDDTTGGTTGTPLDLSGYSSIIIYKNIAETTASTMLSAFQSNSGFDSSTATSSTSCTDYGFTDPIVSDAGGLSSKMYTDISATYVVRSCAEYDYTNVSYANGSTNIIAYYGN